MKGPLSSCQRTWGPILAALVNTAEKELHEDEYAYDIILRLGRELMKRGPKVHFIIQGCKGWNPDQAILNNSKRETCMGKAIPLNQVARLQQRCGCGEPHVPEG